MRPPFQGGRELPEPRAPSLRCRRNGAGAISYFRSLSAAGFAATAISYGPARMGFGLFVPEFRTAFSMSAPAIGLISGLGFAGYLLGLLAAEAMLVRRGPRAPVVTGLLAATVGMAIVAAAPTLPVLAAGVFLAASSAGFAWTPFNDAVHRKIGDGDRPAVLARVSTGTSLGIVGAGLASLGMALTGLSWRACWAFFAAAGAVALVISRIGLRDVGKAVPAKGQGNGWRDLLNVRAIPLFAIGFIFGVTTAIYIAFAADHLVATGGVPGVPAAATPALLFIFYGLFGLTGLFTGRVKAKAGLPALLRTLLLAGALSLVLVAVTRESWAGLVVSAGLQGVYVMMTSAVLALWSERLFPSLSAMGFTATLLATAVGSVLGPALAGVASEAMGAATMFIGAAALPAIAAAALRNRHARDRPAAITA